MALDLCKNVFSSISSEQMDEIFITFCIYIDKYKNHVVFNARYVWSILAVLWPLIDVRILFMLNILWISLWISIKFCICIDTDKM